jgi:hypothetical protein
MSTDTWKAYDVGYWTDASDWSHGIPTSTSDVVIPMGVVYITGNAGAINSLSIQSGALLIEAGLDVLGPAGFGSAGVATGYIDVSGSLEFASGQITTIAENCSFILDGGFIADAGHLNSNSALTGLETIAGELALDGPFGGQLNIKGPLNVTRSGEIMAIGGGSWKLEADGVLTNNGLIGREGGKIFVSTTKGLINHGTIGLTADDVRLAGPLTNDGRVSVNADSQNFYWWVGGAGSFELIGAGSNLGLFGGVDGHQTIYFDSREATLTLRDTSAYFGKIGGFGAGDTIDAKDFRTGTTWDFVENSNNASGVLTLMNGVDEARLLFYGSYAKGDFSVASSSAGTSIKFV